MWFTIYHAEKLPSAIERNVNQIRRVFGVLERVLKDKEFLVGDKFSYADAAFVTWYLIIPLFADRINIKADFPVLNAWLEHMKARPVIAKILHDQEAAMKAK